MSISPIGDLEVNRGAESNENTAEDLLDCGALAGSKVLFAHTQASP